MKTVSFDDFPNPRALLCLTCLIYMKAHPEALRVLEAARDTESVEEVLLSSGHWSEMLVYSLENWRSHAQEAAESGLLHPFIMKALSESRGPHDNTHRLLHAKALSVDATHDMTHWLAVDRSLIDKALRGSEPSESEFFLEWWRASLPFVFRNQGDEIVRSIDFLCMMCEC